MSEYPQEFNDSEEKIRPTLLTVLVVLSLMTIASGLFSNLIGIMTGPIPADEIQEMIDANMGQVNQLYEMGQPYWGDKTFKIINMVTYTNANFYLDRMINISAYSIGLFAVLNMLRGVKVGFHLYIIYNLIALFGIYASVPIGEIPGIYFGFFGFISLLFIFLYSKNIHWMTK